MSSLSVVTAQINFHKCYSTIVKLNNPCFVHKSNIAESKTTASEMCVDTTSVYLEDTSPKYDIILHLLLTYTSGFNIMS